MNKKKKYAVITMDVEDWYHTYFPEDNVDRSYSLLDGLDVALDIMKQRNIKGSFFVVGEIAEQLADKIKEMDHDGHDIACHNHEHIRPLSMDVKQYRNQLEKAKHTIEDVLGHEVNGYRAPSFAIDDERLAIVETLGFKWDSSKLQPQKSAKYGSLKLPEFKQLMPCVYRKENGFTEFEVSTQKIGSMNMLLGGGYIRMLPWPFMKWMTKRYVKTGKPYVMYIHPIDLSPKEMPKVEGCSMNKYLRTHYGRHYMAKRFKKVLDLLEKNGYEFVTFDQLYKNIIETA